MEAGYSDGLASAGQVGIEMIHLREMHVLPSDILVAYEHSESDLTVLALPRPKNFGELQIW